jgi:hypothetical protein
VIRRARRRSPRRCAAFGALLVVAAASMLVVPRAHAQCPSTSGDVFAFLSADPSNGRCPATPNVRWADAQVTYDCGFLTDAAHAIDCGDADAACVASCEGGAADWNAALIDRFRFDRSDVGTPVGFCDPNDGRTSVGGSDAFCDGTAFPQNVIAVTLRFTETNGNQIDADITVNQRFSFTTESLQATLAHEFGHVLGLDHPNECGRAGNVLMRSASLFRRDDPCFVSGPVLDDVNGARTIYPLTGPGPQPICGDADGSGVIVEADAVQALRAAAGLSNNCVDGNCDVDGNGAVTVTDGVNILRAAAGLPIDGTCGR